MPTSDTRRRRPPVRGRGACAGGEADEHPGRPARRGRRRGGRRLAPLGRALLAGPERAAAGPVKDGSGRSPGRAPPRPNRAVVRLREAPPRRPPLTGADPSIAATSARPFRLTVALKVWIGFVLAGECGRDRDEVEQCGADGIGGGQIRGG